MQEVSRPPRPSRSLSPFSDKEFLRILVTLALPIVIQRLLISSVNLLDSVMVGRLGDLEVAAVGIANQLYFVYALFLEGIAGGCSIFISQYWGAGKRESILHVLGMGICAVSITGFLFSCLGLFTPRLVLSLFSRAEDVLGAGSQYLTIIGWSYLVTGISFILAAALRAIGNSRLPMRISAFSLSLNAIFNYLLIFGKGGFPRMGVRGAALATLIARFAEFFLLCAAILRKGSPLRGRAHDYFSFHASFAMRVFSTSLPVMLNDMFWGIGFTLYTVAYGLLGTNALASTQIARNIEQIFLVFDFGIASAALVMVGNLIGAGQSDKARDYARKLILISLAVGVGMGLILFCSAPFILTFYQVSQTVAKDAISILYLFAATLPVKVAASTVIVGIYRGGGTAAYAARSELFALWMVGLPLSFFGATVLNLPITLLVLCQFSEDLVKLTLGLIRLRRGDWIRSVL